jgi:acetylornithine/N-succinyldiaminopimelate aminotransferase
VKPDIMAMAKAIGNGVPVGAFAMSEKVAEKSLAPGDHGTTYGGNPFVCAAVNAVLDIFEKEKILDHVNDITVYLEEKLDKLVEYNEFIETRRGKGLMQGLVLTKPVGEVIKKCMNHGLIAISAGGNVLRLVPPLVITEAHVDEFVEKLTLALNE